MGWWLGSSRRTLQKYFDGGCHRGRRFQSKRSRSTRSVLCISIYDDKGVRGPGWRPLEVGRVTCLGRGPCAWSVAAVRHCSTIPAKRHQLPTKTWWPPLVASKFTVLIIECRPKVGILKINQSLVACLTVLRRPALSKIQQYEVGPVIAAAFMLLFFKPPARDSRVASWTAHSARDQSTSFVLWARPATNPLMLLLCGRCGWTWFLFVSWCAPFCLSGRACADAGEVRQALVILDNNLSMRGANGFSYSSILDALARQVSIILCIAFLPCGSDRKLSWRSYRFILDALATQVSILCIMIILCRSEQETNCDRVTAATALAWVRWLDWWFTLVRTCLLP